MAGQGGLKEYRRDAVACGIVRERAAVHAGCCRDGERGRFLSNGEELIRSWLIPSRKDPEGLDAPET